MELQFKKKACPYVKTLVNQCREQELTQEIRLPDAMGDIGRVLGAWGQVIIRGKEWRPDRVAVSGGVMAWVFYVPENENVPQMVETWLPFHEQWVIPETQHDGMITAMGSLTFCDARSVSARKLMLRAGLALDVQVYIPAEQMLYIPQDLPEHIQVRTLQQPVLLPAEAGEKNFIMEEQIQIPAQTGTLQKILRYDLTPSLLENRVSGSRVIFRGTANVHVVGLDGNAQICSFDTEIPFSQYTQLDRDYEEGTEAAVRIAVTNLELEPGDGQMLNMKAGLSGQYIIKQEVVTDVADDAYSPVADVQVQKSCAEFEVMKHQGNMTVSADRPGAVDGGSVADVAFLSGLPEIHSADGKLGMLLCGRFYVLYYDQAGQLQSMTQRWEKDVQTEFGTDMHLRVSVQPVASENLEVEYVCTQPEGLEMISAITVGEEKKAADRPAMVICRAGNMELWDIAKENGSTVAAIREMNKLEGNPSPDQMLLIPIL